MVSVASRKVDRFMASSDNESVNRVKPRDEASDVAHEPTDIPSAESHNRATSVVQEADELLDEIDEVLRESLGLDKDASDERFAELADTMVAGYVQKGGQ
jgi:2-succinyl-5-enolpyruvyl-6-hydroxy-3-cyclohexene-1-carboxylate synthase